MPNQATLSITTGLAHVRFEKHLADACIGSIWLGRYLNGNDAGRTVVLRRISKQWLSHADAEWVRQGAAAYSNVRHPSLTKLLGVIENGDDLVSVSEHIQGVRLLELMRTVFADGVPIPATVAVRMVLDAGRATWTAHRLSADAGLLPALRLFLPEGVLIASYGSTLLTEVGLLCALARCVVPRTVPDLLAQLAPEELGAKTAHAGSPEVFSLGVVLWELLTNRWLFSRKSDSRTHQEMLLSKIPSLDQIERFGLSLPEDIVSLVTKATSRDPRQRFGSVHDMVLALESLPAHFVASEQQVAEVLRQRTPLLLKGSKSEEAERTISGTFSELRTDSPSVAPPSIASYEWDRPTFAQRTLIECLPGDVNVARISTLDVARGSMPHSGIVDGVSPKPRRRGLGMLAASVLLTVVGVSGWAYRSTPLRERLFASAAPAGAVSIKPAAAPGSSAPTVTADAPGDKSRTPASISTGTTQQLQGASTALAAQPTEARAAEPDRGGAAGSAAPAALSPMQPASSAKASPVMPVKQAGPVRRAPHRKAKPAPSSTIVPASATVVSPPVAPAHESNGPAIDAQWGI